MTRGVSGKFKTHLKEFSPEIPEPAPPSLSTDDVRDLFGNIEQLLHISKNMLSQLRPIIEVSRTRARTQAYTHARIRTQSHTRACACATHNHAHVRTHTRACARTRAHARRLLCLCAQAWSETAKLGPVFIELAPFFLAYKDYARVRDATRLGYVRPLSVTPLAACPCGPVAQRGNTRHG
jgi:hypothetical protein